MQAPIPDLYFSYFPDTLCDIEIAFPISTMNISAIKMTTFVISFKS